MAYEETENNSKDLEAEKEMAESFGEYFGTDEVICENIIELNKTINNFFSWRRDMGRGLGKEEAKNKTSKIDFGDILPKDSTKIGIIFDENQGVIIILNYGYLKKLFTGNYKEIPYYLEFLYGAVVTKVIPSFILKKFISENPERALKLFKEAHEMVSNMKDIEKIIDYYKPEWEEDYCLNIRLFEDLKETSKEKKE